MCTKEENALFEFPNLNGRKRSRKQVSKIPSASIRDLDCNGRALQAEGGKRSLIEFYLVPQHQAGTIR